MKKIDIHLHIPFDKEMGEMFSTAEEMIPHLEKMGIIHGILMSISPQWNEQNMKTVEKYPDRFSWMYHAEPSLGGIMPQLMRAKARGAIGIGEITLNKLIIEPFIQDLFLEAERLNMPVLFHMSPEEGYSTA